MAATLASGCVCVCDSACAPSEKQVFRPQFCSANCTLYKVIFTHSYRVPWYSATAALSWDHDDDTVRHISLTRSGNYFLTFLLSNLQSSAHPLTHVIQIVKASATATVSQSRPKRTAGPGASSRHPSASRKPFPSSPRQPQPAPNASGPQPGVQSSQSISLMAGTPPAPRRQSLSWVSCEPVYLSSCNGQPRCISETLLRLEMCTLIAVLNAQQRETDAQDTSPHPHLKTLSPPSQHNRIPLAINPSSWHDSLLRAHHI